MSVSSKKPGDPTNLRITPRLGRLRVRNHCSFFWAEVPFRRLVVREPDHCAECLEYVRADAEQNGFAFEVVSPDERTMELLRVLPGTGPAASFRRNRRVGCVMPVELFDASGRRAGVCRSISRGGLFVTGLALPRGENLKISVHVPGFGAVSAVGRVSYTYEHPDGAGSGVVFTDIAAADASRIEEFIQLSGRRTI